MSLSFPLAAVLALSAGAALAQAPQVRQHYPLDGRSIVAQAIVDTSDLDLASDAGLRTLSQRLEAAADAVCGGPAPAGDSYHREAFLLCRDTAIRAAVARLPPPARVQLAKGR